MTSDVLCLWVIFEHPVDYPDHFVVRRCFLNGQWTRMAQFGSVVGSLEEARAEVPRGLTRIPRAEGDEGQIVETWL